jgi:hypothetical protein
MSEAHARRRAGLSSVWRADGRSLSDKGWAPLRYWLMWYAALGVAIAVFYAILTPIWIGLRVAAWIAEFRARRR